MKNYIREHWQNELTVRQFLQNTANIQANQLIQSHKGVAKRKKKMVP